MSDFAENLLNGFNLINENGHGILKKNVKFNLKPTMHLMYVWAFAYSQARKGDWEMVARDRIRFQRRIEKIRLKLDPILESNHRDNVYKSRFEENKVCSL